MKTLGEKILHYRTLLGLSQRELGELVGVDQSIISKLEIGTMQETVKIAHLAKVFKVDAYWLATNEGVAEPYMSSTNEGELAAKVIDGIQNDKDRQHVLKIVNTFTQPAEGTNGNQ